MLEQIFSSKARLRLLNLFLNQTEQKYYARELARDLALHLNSVRRELENLLNFGIIKQIELKAKDLKALSKKELGINEKKYYMTDTNFLLYPELKNLFSKSKLLSCQEFINDFAKEGNLKALYLLGVFVADSLAPTDILVIGDVNRKLFLTSLKKLELDIARELNYTILSEEEYTYRLDIHDIFLNEVLARRKLIAIDNLNKKV